MKNRFDARRAVRAGLCALALTAVSAGCVSRFMDQVAVPGTDERLVVGQRYFLLFPIPEQAVWVLRDGEFERVEVVRR